MLTILLSLLVKLAKGNSIEVERSVGSEKEHVEEYPNCSLGCKEGIYLSVTCKKQKDKKNENENKKKKRTNRQNYKIEL